MKKNIFLILLLAFTTSVFAQKDTLTYDPQAKKILDKLSATTKKYESIRISFSYGISNKVSKKNESFDGSAFIKGNKYKLILQGGNEIFSDGKTVYSYVKDAKEMNITDNDPNDESALNPAKLFTIYEKGFKYRFRGEAKENVKQKDKDNKVKNASKVLYSIDLYPEKPKEKKYTMIKLKIDKALMQITSIQYLGKDGTDYLIDITEFVANAKVTDQTFTFDKKNYPKDMEIIDMRD